MFDLCTVRGTTQPALRAALALFRTHYVNCIILPEKSRKQIMNFQTVFQKGRPRKRPPEGRPQAVNKPQTVKTGLGRAAETERSNTRPCAASFSERESPFRRLALLFPEYQQLAGRVIGNDHEYRHCQLHEISIPAEDVHQQPHQPRLRRAGADPAAHKFGKLRDHRPCGPVMAPEHEGLVGHIGKQHRQRPGGGIAPGAGKPRPVVKGEIHRVIDQRGQHAEEKIGDQLPVLFQKRL